MRIGIMSFAHTHAIAYAVALRERGDVEVMVADPDFATRPAGESGGAGLAAELGVAYADDYDALFAWGPDAVVVCSENVRHLADVKRAARAGVDVLCEKPLATTVADARRIVEVCADAGVRLMTALPVGFSSEFVALCGLVGTGGLGPVVSISGTNNGQLPTERAWFADPTWSGGGAITDHTVHVADLIFRLMPGVDAVEVYATANTLLRPQREAETAGLVSIRYANGVAAVIDCSWSKPDHYPVWGGLTLQVTTRDGAAELAPFAQRVDGFSERHRAPIWSAYGQDLDAAMLDEFLGAIREARQPHPTGEDGVRTVEIVAAAYESLRSGAPVALRQIGV